MKGKLKAAKVGVIALSTAVLSMAGLIAAPAQAFADDHGAPVIYLNRHGFPTICSFEVTTWDSQGRFLEKNGMTRNSCVGTLWLNARGVRTIHIYNAQSLGDVDRPNLDVTISYARDDRAYCVLAKADGIMHYTNSSPKGGDCNGD